jgi:hypothetical protein
MRCQRLAKHPASLQETMSSSEQEEEEDEEEQSERDDVEENDAPEEEEEEEEEDDGLPDLDRVDRTVANQIYDAVRSALPYKSRQPIVLHIDAPDGPAVLTFCPASMDAGRWLLLMLEAADEGLHTSMVRALAWPDEYDVKEAFGGLTDDGAITSLDVLGEFCALTDPRNLINNASPVHPRVHKKDLCGCLYTQYCRVYDHEY